MTSRRLILIGVVLPISLGLVLALASLAARRWIQPEVEPPRRLDRKRLHYPHPELKITIDNYPKVDGSTSTQPLQMILACKVFGVETIWTHSEVDDTRTLSPNWYTVYAPLPG